MAPKIKFIGKVTVEKNVTYPPAYDVFRLLPNKDSENDPITAEPLYVQSTWAADDLEVPFRCETAFLVGRVTSWSNVWIYRQKAFRVEDPADCDPAEIAVRIEHMVLTSEREREAEYDRIKAELAALKNLEPIPSATRERIPEAIQIFVWQRDQGRCVQCGSKERLEFDHIIPVVKGGSNTARNIQLLCEACNRKKGKRIGS